MTGSEQVRHTAVWPPVNGCPGIVQGAYGAAGNLELVAPAIDDGLWVGWFNADPVDARVGAVRGAWSGALRFGLGRRYVAATIAQVSASDRALEVLAIDVEGALARHVWTAGEGFREQSVVRAGVTSTSPMLVLADGRQTCVVADLQHRVWQLTAAVDEHPRWEPQVLPLQARAAQVDAARHEGHVDLLTVEGGLAWLACPVAGRTSCGRADVARLAVDAAGARWILRSTSTGGHLSLVGGGGDLDLPYAHDVAIAATVVDGERRLEIIARTDSELCHRIVGVAAGQPMLLTEAPVLAQVWVDPAVVTPTVHRGL